MEYVIFFNIKELIMKNKCIRWACYFYNLKLQAFTLSEVLITLGIIGVVAAMTLPALISKYSTFVLQQQFRKVYSIIQTAVQKVQFDMGENVRCYYGGPQSSDWNWIDCPTFYNEIAKQMNVIQTCKGKALEQGCLPPESYKPLEEVFAGGDNSDGMQIYKENCPGFSSEFIEAKNTVYVLNGGFLLILYGYEGKSPLFIVDINGKRRPNKYGYDLFSFQFAKANSTDSYIKLEPNTRCIYIEKGGFSTSDFINLINRGKADF